MEKVILIGAGPAGLVAAYELLKAGGYEVVVLEESEDFGGISKTVNVNGNRMDMGGHRFFSKDRRVTDWWAAFLPTQGAPAKDDARSGKDFAPEGPDPEKCDAVMLIRKRVSRIYYKGALFDYPVRLNWNTLRGMGFLATALAGLSYLRAAAHRLPENNLENFYINRFGRHLYSMFFEGYTEKLWGRHPREISAEWGAQRVKGLSVRALLKDMLGKIFRFKDRPVETSLIERFHYPKYGPGQLWTLAADEIRSLGGEIFTNKKVIAIDCGAEGRARTVRCADGAAFPCDMLISSMPVKDLVNALGTAPADIRRIASALPYRDFQTVGALVPADKFLLRGAGKLAAAPGIAPDSWLYVQDTSVKLGRIQIFNNWSPYMVKDFQNTVWLGLEYFCDEGDEFWEMPDEEYVRFAISEMVKIGIVASASDVLSAHRQKVKKAYPAYFDAYAEFGAVRKFLDAVPNLYCIGRNGQHRYNNMDHSMLTAFEAVKNIVAGATDKNNIWNVNTEQEYHEEGGE